MKEGLAPIVSVDCTHLIVGTMPGDQTLRLQRYYSHPGNQLWLILEKVYGEVVSDDYERRVAFLLWHGLAIWDILRSADRKGSLDSAIRIERPNDFAWLFERFPRLRTVGFNGRKAPIVL